MRSVGAMLLTGSILIVAILQSANAAVSPVLAIIVPAGASTHRLSINSLARIYIRKRSFWSDGSVIVPVNLPADHPLRRLFSQIVLQRSLDAQEEYWNQQYFHGVMPPLVMPSETAMRRFIEQTPASIGYAAPCADLPAGVRVLMLIDAQGRAHAGDTHFACDRN